MTNPSEITFVCCVEAGSLEAQTVRMVQSLRKYGGQFANAPVVAVTPRFGSPLSRKTHQIFDQYEIEHLYLRSDLRRDQYTWNHFMNKPNAILAVDERVRSEAIAWLDSDLLIVGDLAPLALQEQESFLACTSDQIGATTGPDDPTDHYWTAICKHLGIDIEALPWVTTEIEQTQVRYYFNSGLFAYRRETAFAKQYLENCIRILDGRIASQAFGFFFTDQCALGLTAFQLNLPWRSLPCAYNYPVSASTHATWYNEAALQNARVVHYHDSMWSPFWPTFLQCIQKTHPEVAGWLGALGPMSNESPIPYRVLSRLLKYFRDKNLAAYKMACSVV